MIDNTREKLFTRRAFILGGLQTGLLTTILGRMYYLEIVSNQHYKALSDKNRIHSQLIIPLRGQILDRKGRMIATHHRVHRAIIIRDQAQDWFESLKTAQPLLTLSDESVEEISREIKGKPRFIPVTLKENISWEEVTKIALHLSDLSGVLVEEGRVRFYPYPFETSHFTGYVATPSPEEINGEPMMELPGMKMGKSGLEKSQESILRGNPSVKQVEVNAVRKVVRELSMKEGKAGENVILSIDLELQKIVYDKLIGCQSASAIVLEVEKGEILAYASVPGFDTNLFVQGIPSKKWKELLNNPYHPLINKPIAGQYAPGSTFKMVVALAALEAGIIDAQTTVSCTGYTLVGNHKFHCWKSMGHGVVDLKRAIAVSCDCYFYHIGGVVGVEKIAAMAKQFGFGHPTGIEISGEKGGLIPSRSWKSKLLGTNWTKGETCNTSIGQGYILATPLQLAVMTARLATGKRVVPTFLKKTEENFESLEIKAEFLSHIAQGMKEAVNTPTGTAYGARIVEEGMEMSGKTATTQVRRITKKERMMGKTNSSSWKWDHRDHAFFVGFAPSHAPKFAAVVFVEHGVSGGRIAAPLARDILLTVQQREKGE